MRKKYQIGGVMGLSSSPLTSLMPQTSPSQRPNFGNAFLFNPYALLLVTPLMPNYALEFKNKMQPSMDLMKFLIGLATQDSSDPLTALKGKEMVNEVIGTSSGSTDTSGGSSFNWDAGFSALSSVGSRVGGQAGTILSGVGNIGSSIKRIADTKKGIKNGVAGAGAAKTGAIGSAIGAASDLVGSFLPLKGEYAGSKGDITQTMDSVYDGISDAAMSFGPAGMLVGGIMKGGSLLSKGINAIGGGTDGQTTLDSVLGSSFLSLTPLGLINGFFGKKSNNFEKDVAAFNTTGSAYLGTELEVDDALSKSNKKYGLFSSNARRKANSQIRLAAGRQDIISNIADQVQDYYNLMASMDVINNNRYDFELRGGYQLNDVRIGKSGFKFDNIDRAKSILSKFKDLQVNHLQKGGEFEYYLSTLPESQRDSTNFRVKDYWIFNGKPKDFKEARRRGMFTLEKDGWHASTIAWNPKTGEGEFMKSPDHPSIQLEIDWYNSDNGSDFRSEYELVKSSPYWKYVRRKEIPSHKLGGSFIELTVEETSIELIDPMSIPEFLNGGSINVIPDGALHARKHNMDVDGITRKGIPVVSEKDGEIEQQAEVEKEELILRLEVTLKLEELEKKFYSDESTQEEKDECALEAGKLLVNEILYNTLDNTNNLL